jgi:hypothetical protein
VLLQLGDRANHANVCIDNEALVKKLNQKPDSLNLPDHPLVNTLCLICKQRRIHVQWIRSHPELRKKREHWSFQECGNRIADLLTNNDVTAACKELPYRVQHQYIQLPEEYNNAVVSLYMYRCRNKLYS